MGDLNAKARKELPKQDFAMPTARAYPIPDEGHAQAALARVEQYGNATERAAVRSAVKARFPHMDVTHGPDHPRGCN